MLGAETFCSLIDGTSAARLPPPIIRFPPANQYQSYSDWQSTCCPSHSPAVISVPTCEPFYKPEGLNLWEGSQTETSWILTTDVSWWDCSTQRAWRSCTVVCIHRGQSDGLVLRPNIRLIPFFHFLTPHLYASASPHFLPSASLEETTSSTNDIISALPITTGFSSSFHGREEWEFFIVEMFVLWGLEPLLCFTALHSHHGLTWHTLPTGNSLLYQTIDWVTPLTHPMIKKKKNKPLPWIHGLPSN